MALDDGFSLLWELSTQLIGQPCWSATCGGAAGSNLLIDFGRSIPSERRIRNSAASSLQQTCEGEYQLFIEGSWELVSNHTLLCTSQDDSTVGGKMMATVTRLIGQRIANVNVMAPTGRLAVTFSDGSVLTVLCDAAADNDWADYSIATGNTTVVVGPRGRVEVEKDRSN